jgi:pSer/pThr/pTyr-binding forkhead associated (FHA) protein
MQIVLVMFRSDGQRRSFSIHKEQTILGRREDCDVRIPLGEISRKHCKLTRQDDGSIKIEDCGSSNGTYVNGKRVQEATLEAGDTLQIGPVAFVIQINGLPHEDEIQPMRGKAGAARKAVTALQPDERTLTGANGEFDPSAVLGGPEDSRAGAAVDSIVARDVAADLERVNRATR